MEGILLSHEGVSDCGVVGVPDPDSGELPRAYVVRSDENLTVGELYKYVNGQFFLVFETAFFIISRILFCYVMTVFIDKNNRLV